MTDVTRLTAAELGRLIAARRGLRGRGDHAPTWTGSPRWTSGCTRSCTSTRGRARRGPPRSTTPARRATSSARWPGCRSRSRTSIATKGVPTTAGSKILEGWRPPYDATIVDAAARGRRWCMLGKTNMDEFAMGSSTEYSAYGPTHNPWDLDRIPGGSGGGSAAAVAAYEAPLAIGTDTGGSIRQPAAVTGTVGRQADLRRHVALRADRVLVLAGHAGPVRPDRRGRGAAARGHRRPRPARLDVDPAPVPDVVAAARLGADGDLTGVRLGVVTRVRRRGRRAGRRWRRSARPSRRWSSWAPRSSRCPARTSRTRCRPTT